MKTLNKLFFLEGVAIKNLIIVSFTLLILISISCVSADENITEIEPVNPDDNITETEPTSPDDNITETEPTTPNDNITEFNCEIQNSNGTFDLNKDYIGNCEIIISKSMTINGNGYSIISTSQNLKVNIDNDINLILKNITFKNDKIELNSGNSTINVTFIDCAFNENQIKNEITIDENISSESYQAGNASKIVNLIAKEIVDNSTGLEAAEKLAIWIGQNIQHETAAGFYQRPDETLMRMRGNCCSQALLFLQMCEAVGVNEEHKLYFVHVGTSIFHHRHFFAMIDNIFVDVDAMPDNPWGNAKTFNDAFFRITEYPYLPLVREY